VKISILIFSFSLLTVFSVNSQSISVTESFGWLESACVKWTSVESADSYNVYYSGQGIVDKKIDSQLIRNYGSFYRADIPGIAAGTYTIKITPIVQSTEGVQTETSPITVLAHDRNGFAFANNRVPGAYKLDGTPKDNAVILYVTDKNKNTISTTITGATTNPCVGIQTILDGIKKGKDTRPFIVRFIGQIKDPDYLLDGDLVIENDNNANSYITLEGIGDDAVADGWGIRLKKASNIEVRNIAIMNCDSGEGDNIGLQQDNDYIWIHNCDFFYGNAGSDADQAKGDGALDCKKSNLVTFSYNHFWDTGKSNLLGLGESTNQGLYISYHHNWYDHSDSRHPRVRYFSAHVYNNYYDGISKYGVGSTLGSSVFVENNYFRNCKYPMLTSMQGSDVFGGSEGTFSGEDGGSIKSYNNIMNGQTRYVSYNASSFPIEFDAFETTTRSEIISNTIKSKNGANIYNNFDTDAAHYIKNLIPDQPEAGQTNVTTYAGRIKGGDFKWTFNNAIDDASYDVNPALKSQISTYKTILVSIQGETTNPTSTHTLVENISNSTQTVITGNSIENIVFTWGGDAQDVTVTGLTSTGLIFEKNTSNKTVTISGTPTATLNYSVTTVGLTGTPITLKGTITVNNPGIPDNEAVHNFTTAGKTSSFFTITGNLSTNYGTVTYNSLTLTQCLKMESSTNISFTTNTSGVLTLVLNSNYTGTIAINGTNYTAVGGIIRVDLVAGQHNIKKGSGSNYLFYIQYSNVNPSGLSSINSFRVYPNPVIDKLYIEGNNETLQVIIYSLSGKLLCSANKVQNTIDLSNLPKGNYLMKISDRKKVRNIIISKK